VPKPGPAPLSSTQQVIDLRVRLRAEAPAELIVQDRGGGHAPLNLWIEERVAEAMGTR
jgi:hypothetical protein